MHFVFMNLYDAHVKILDKVCGQSAALTCRKDIGIHLHFLKCFFGKVLFELLKTKTYGLILPPAESISVLLILHSCKSFLHDLALINVRRI
jgi:hypothetical protein